MSKKIRESRKWFGKRKELVVVRNACVIFEYGSLVEVRAFCTCTIGISGSSELETTEVAMEEVTASTRNAGKIKIDSLFVILCKRHLIKGAHQLEMTRGEFGDSRGDEFYNR